MSVVTLQIFVRVVYDRINLVLPMSCQCVCLSVADIIMDCR